MHGPEDFDRAACQSLDEKARHAKFVVAISSYCRSQLYRWVPQSLWHKIRIVRCGLDLVEFPEEAPEPLSKNRIVCVGRLCEQKGQLLLIEAVKELVQQGIELQLRLIGDGDMRAECEAAIARWNLKEAITITGWASGEQVRQELQDAALFVLPSFAEGLPVVIMEALASGRPAISTYIAGIPELVRPNENGWLVPAGDMPALAATLQEALGTRQERLAVMGRNGRTEVCDQHDIKKEIAKLAELVKE